MLKLFKNSTIIVVCASLLFLASATFLRSKASIKSDQVRIQYLEKQLQIIKSDLSKIKSSSRQLENKTQYFLTNSAGDGATRFKSPFSECGFIIHGNGYFERLNIKTGRRC